MEPTEISRYLAKTAGVEGWFFPIDAYLFGAVNGIQKDIGVRGNLFEIGVHHGKTALLLVLMRAEGEQVAVCDVFGRQDLNVDGSGEGSRDVFVRNLRTLTPRADAEVAIHEKRSDELTVADTTDNCRFFHIDGGHLADDVVGDLHTALSALHPEGIVVLDDLFNSNWPGVAEGFFRFCSSEPNALAPILIGGNKVFFCRPDAADKYDGATDSFAEIESVAPFTFERKRWLGRHVTTAVRHQWVDLAPIDAALAHLPERGWKRRLLGWLR